MSCSQFTRIFRLSILFFAVFGVNAVAQMPLTITSPIELPNASIGIPYSVTVTASGGTAPYNWSIAGVLPEGLVLNAATGEISGTTPYEQSVGFNLTVTDGRGLTATQVAAIYVTGTTSFKTVSLLNAVTGFPYFQTLQAAGGLPFYTWVLTEGALPNGLSLNNTSGVIAGTPTTDGTSTFTIQVADVTGRTASKTLNMDVSTGLTVTTRSLLKDFIPGNAVGPYSQVLDASGGSLPYSWSIIAGSLPPGLTLNGATGTICGAALAAGAFGMLIQVQDGTGKTASKPFVLQIDPPVQCTNCSILPVAIIGSPYTYTLVANGGTPPYSWRSGLPAGLNIPGLSISPTGTISGTPTVTGRFSSSVTVYDSGAPNGGIYGTNCCGGEIQVSGISLTVSAPLAITTNPINTGFIGVTYLLDITTTGGSGPATSVSIIGGALPDGLILSKFGTPTNGFFGISGTPTQKGTFNFVVEANDGRAKVTKALSINIIDAIVPLAISTVGFPSVVAAAPNSLPIAASGGVAPYVWFIAAGSLPPGMGLDPLTGIISGATTVINSFAFTIGVTDSGGNNASQSLLISVIGPPFPMDVSPRSGAASGQTLTFTFGYGKGWAALGVVNVLLNDFLDGRNACYIAYVPASNLLYLVPDSSSGLLPGLPLSQTLLTNGTGSTSNGQCTIYGAGSSATGRRNVLTLTLNVTFSSSFRGNKVIYAAARDAAGNNSGWQTMGVWQVPGVVPATTTSVVGMSQANSTAPAGSFTFTFADSIGWQDLGVVNVLLNTSLDGRKACYLAYGRALNTLYLVNDQGTALLPGLLMNGSGSLGNSQCTVDGTGSSVAVSGNALTLTLKITKNGAFSGNRIFYLAARDQADANNTDWQAAGTWWY